MGHYMSEDKSETNSIPGDDGGQELCVLCHGKTNYTKAIPIGQRKGYIIGRGQFCDSCFDTISASYITESAKSPVLQASAVGAIKENPETIADPPKKIAVILPFEKSGEYFVEQLGIIKKKPVFDFIKRFFDIILAVLCGVLMLIPMAVIAVIIKRCSKGSVFYAQERLGLNGKVIKVLKFRTMYPNAEDDGMQWSMGDDDPRIFPFGRFLRKTRLDELPQWWCVLKNEMSFVGPRPERECFYNEFESYIHGFRERLKVKPGLTGYAQVNGGYDLRPEEKIVYDVEYIKKRSLWMDFKIIIKTVAVVFNHKGAK